MTSFLLLTILIVSDGRVAERTHTTYYVDGYVEINNYDIHSGFMDQIIIKEWVEEKNTHISMAFFVRKSFSLSKNDGPYKYKFTIFNGSDIVYIYCKYYTETWTTYDTEIEDRNIISKDIRDARYKPRKATRKFITHEYRIIN